MQIKARSYPHPVLSYFGDDIVDSAFQPMIRVKPSKTSYTFDVAFKTSNKDLVAALSKKSAQNAVHVECATTRYRNLFSSSHEKFSFEIPQDKLDGRVDLCSFILSSQDSSEYRIVGVHKDYTELNFSIQKADTLAVGPDSSFIAEKKTDPLRKIPSIFLITQNDSVDAAAIDINLSGAKIVVALSKAAHEGYRILSKSQPMHAVLCSIVIIPVLVSILETLKHAASSADDSSSLESRRWYTVLAKRLKTFGVEVTDAASFKDSSLVIAQRLVGDPLAISISALQGYEQTAE
jgi:hypothetical protein